jgi:hypothetical protein
MSMKKIRLVAATALAAGLALAATPASVRTAAPKGSCKLLTTRQAARILGTPVGSTKRTSNARADSCTWNAKKKGTGGLKGQPGARDHRGNRASGHRRLSEREGQGAG